MAVIKIDFGRGGANLTPRGQGTPSLASVLRDAADDLEGLQVDEITSADATDAASAITLANEIKAVLNAANAYTVKTVKG